LIALPEELRSLADHYGEHWKVRPKADNAGSDFFFEGPGGYRCVAALMPRMGPTTAALVAQRLLAQRPAAIVNIGIAGSLRLGSGAAIGDVIVPRQVDAYDETGKIEGDRWQRRGSNFRLSMKLLTEVIELQFQPSARDQLFSWIEAGRSQLAALREGPERTAIDTLIGEGLLR
ncbi:MAG: hypothetical protein KC457_37490, partial [Myxococcales bacterium]|nr:hypothetical protein [Myxococcales bacterium]